MTPEHLAELAIRSARLEHTGRDGITYLMHAKQNQIVTPLSLGYEAEILQRTGTADLEGALKVIRARR